MKKSTLIMILSLVLAVALGVGGTLAYLTDTEDDINVMTVGKVDIDLIEQQRDGNGGLEPFEDGKVLLPLVGSAQGEKDEMGMPTASNYVDKIISVSNKNASSDAWVRLLVGFPVDMEREGTANGPLHWNLGNKFTGVDDQYDAAGWSEDWELVETEETFEHDGIQYKVYAFNYKHILAPGAETDTAAVTGFYLDSRVDWDDETNEYFMYIDGVKKMVSGMAADGSVYIPVVAQAVQASGFETYEEAFETAELPINPWAADESLLDEMPVTVSSVDELEAALEEIKNSEDNKVKTVKLAAGEYDEINVPEGLSNAKIIGVPGTVVGHLDLRDSQGVMVSGITFDAAKAQPVYGAKGAQKDYVASISGGSDNGARAPKFVQVTGCTFTGEGADNYVPICFEDQGRPTSRLETINISDNKFECDAFNYVRINYAQAGEIYVVNNIFGGEGYSTEHNTMNFTGNAAHLTIQNNKIYNWNVEKNAIGTSRQGSNMINVSIKGNTFSNDALVGEGGVVELKSSYTASNCTVDISGNTYAGELTYTDATAPIVKP